MKLEITEERIKRAKERFMEELSCLKRDYERLGKLISLTEEVIQHVTMQNAQAYQDKFDEFENSFECIEVF